MWSSSSGAKKMYMNDVTRRNRHFIRRWKEKVKEYTVMEDGDITWGEGVMVSVGTKGRGGCSVVATRR